MFQSFLFGKLCDNNLLFQVIDAYFYVYKKKNATYKNFCKWLIYWWEQQDSNL